MLLLSDAVGLDISIHALREEGDAGAAFDCNVQHNFYPRPPRGGRRLHSKIHHKKGVRFLSTPSARRATRSTSTQSRREEISIHALREEGDRQHSDR